MSRVRPCLVLLALLAASPSAWAHGDLRWTTLSPADIQRLTASPVAFEYAPFLREHLRAARLVQQSDDHSASASTATASAKGRRIWSASGRRSGTPWSAAAVAR
jgi:methionine-rich copper-binding protein CopC